MRSFFSILSLCCVFILFNSAINLSDQEEYFVLKFDKMEAHLPVIKKKNIKTIKLPYDMPGMRPVYAYFDTLNNYTIIPSLRDPRDYSKTRFDVSNIELSSFAATIRFHCEVAQKNISRFKRSEMYLKNDFKEEQTVLIHLEHDYDCRIYEDESPMTRLDIIIFFNASSYVIEISKPVGTNTIEDEIKWAKSFFSTCVDIDRAY